MNKYFNKKTTVGGKVFSSKKEAVRYLELRLLEKQGYIRDLQLQPKFELQPSFKKNGKTIRAIDYIADFSYYSAFKHKYIVEDVKAFDKKTGKFRSTSDFKIKKKMFEYIFKNKEIILI